MQDTEFISPIKENSNSGHAYITGIAGMIFIVVMGYLAARYNTLTQGWHIFSYRITYNRNDSILFVLGTCAALMIFVEMFLRSRKEGSVFTISPKLKDKKYTLFFSECFINYSLDVLFLLLVVLFFTLSNEYGYRIKAKYYNIWFTLLFLYLKVYLICGLPYVILTRSLQYDPESDRRAYFYPLLKFILKIFKRTGIKDKMAKRGLFDISGDPDIDSFNIKDRKIFLGVMVKMFFIPLMTVFFSSQFFHLAKNFSYIGTRLKTSLPYYGFSIRDFYNISFSFIFSIDVGVAWCGYFMSSRWLKNTMVSVEPTIFGWLVAIICYPPFQRLLGVYFTIPSEKGFLTIPNQPLVLIFAVMSILSYMLYMSATVVFGLRFSNLTHRGIIQKGPYALIRHPAYAAKNFSWWCVMMPYVIFQSVKYSRPEFLLQIFGLIGMTALYYFRAITEERHLSIDPEYQEYCKKVKYRFIPGIY